MVVAVLLLALVCGLLFRSWRIVPVPLVVGVLVIGLALVTGGTGITLLIIVGGQLAAAASLGLALGVLLARWTRTRR